MSDEAPIKAVRRSSVQRMLDNINDMKPNDREELLIKLLDASIEEAPERAKESEPCFLSDFADEIAARSENFGKLVGLRTGFNVVDDMTMGLAPGELTIVAAPTSVGKTLLCLNIAANLAKAKHMVGFLTLEMTRVEVGSRLFKILGDDYDAVTNIIVNKSDKVSWKAVDSFIKRAIELNGIEVLFIDHLHYFARSMENQAEELGLITQEFKHLAIKYNIPIILISHTRKTEGLNGKEREATMNDLRGSSFIAQDADIVLMLNRVWKEGDSGRVQDPEGIKISLEKNRNRYGVPVGTSFIIHKNGLRLQGGLSPEEQKAWDRNKPQPKVNSFSAYQAPQPTPKPVAKDIFDQSNLV